MSEATALALANLVTTHAQAFVAAGERELAEFHEGAAVVLAPLPTVADGRERLNAPATALLTALATLWAAELNALMREVHVVLGLPPPTPLTAQEAQDFMKPGVLNLVNAALGTLRVARLSGTDPLRGWDRQYERGGAFVALRGTMRGSSAGTMNLQANASVIDAARARGDPGWVLGAYNPLDERTAALDFQLVTNRGAVITTARGRQVRSIPGRVGKYTLSNAWVPGSPRLGGDTHDGCRCWLVPEREG